MPPSVPDESVASVPVSGEDPLLSQVTAIYRSMGNPPTASLKTRKLAEARGRAQVSSSVSKALGVARSMWSRRWALLMPAERARVLVATLRAFCKSRRDPAAYDWNQLDYLYMLTAVGAQDSYSEADLESYGPIESQMDDVPWLEVRKHVDAVADACSRAAPDAQHHMRHWESDFLGEGGITRLKLRRLKLAERKAVAGEVALIFHQVHEHLSRSSSAPLNTVLLSADAVFTRVAEATQLAKSRFNILRSFLNDLVDLYDATTGHDVAAAQLSALCDILERRTHVKQERGVVDMRTAEASFAELDVSQQVAAVERARYIVFEVCLQHRESGQLPAVEPLMHKLLEPLHDPRALAPLKRWRLCVDDLSAVVRLYEDVYKAHGHVGKSLSHQLAVLDTYAAAELFVELPEQRQLAAAQRCRSLFLVLSSMKHGPLPPVDDVVGNFLNVLPHPAHDPIYSNAASTRRLCSLEHGNPPLLARRSSSMSAQLDPYLPSARSESARRSL